MNEQYESLQESADLVVEKFHAGRELPKYYMRTMDAKHPLLARSMVWPRAKQHEIFRLDQRPEWMTLSEWTEEIKKAIEWGLIREVRIELP